MCIRDRLCLGQGLSPATPLINKSFPILGRYTYLLLTWAISHSIVYLITAYVCDHITSFQGICLMLFIAALISLGGLYAFVPKDKMLKVKLSQDSTDNIPWKEIIEEEEKYEILEQKEKELFIKKWFKEISK
jgi:hypothetical protein